MERTTGPARDTRAPEGKGNPKRARRGAEFGRELREALRRLRRRPGYALGAVAVLAAGIAATLGAWALVEATLLAPLPFAEPDRLVTIDVTSPRGYGISTSLPNLRDWRDGGQSFELYAGAAGWSLVLSERGPAEVLKARAVLGPYFETLGFRPQAGRLFGAAETEAGAAPVVVLGHAFWQRRLGGDPAIVGQALRLDGTPFTVVGILPPGSGYPSAAATDLYFPMGSLAASLPWNDRDSSFGTRVIARLRQGVTQAQAQGELDRITDRIEAEIGHPSARPRLRSLRDLFVAEQRGTYTLVASIVACFFSIAVVNVLLLAVARTEERRPEMAVRAALGASESQNRRLLVCEGLILSFAGMAAGLGGGWVLLRLGSFWIRQSVPALFADRMAIGPTAVGLAAILGLTAWSLLGLLPGRLSGLGFTAAQGAAAGARRRPSRRLSRGHSRLVLTRGAARPGTWLDPRSLLVGAEVALTLLLVGLASLLAQSEALLGRVDKGFDGRGVWSAQVNAPEEDGATGAAWEESWARILEDTAAIPGVRSTAATLMLPLTDRSWEMGVLPATREWVPNEADSMLFNVVSPAYFRTLGVALLQGRSFGPEDHAKAPLVAIVDDTLAERYWPGEDPIGKQFRMHSLDPAARHGAAESRTVVGVAQNVRHYELESASRIQVYVPMGQAGSASGASLYLLAATDSGDPLALTAPIRERIARLDPDLAVSDTAAVLGRVENALAGRRATSQLTSLFGALSLGLALAGIFALTSYAVAQRQAEFGIRAALGATRRDLLTQVLRRALVQTGAGALVGAGLAALGAPLVRSLLYGIGPFDPRGIGLGLAVVLAAAPLAAALPAWRAARLEPSRVLRPGDRLSG